MTKDYCTIKEVAARASLSEKTLRKYLRSGDIPSFRPDPRGRILIRWFDFEAFMESRRVQIKQDADAKEMLESLLGERRSA